MGKKHVVVCKNKSFITLKYNVSGKIIIELAWISKMSKWENLTTESSSTCWFKKEDCVTNEGSVQSIVIRFEVFSQFKESFNHIWSDDW